MTKAAIPNEQNIVNIAMPHRCWLLNLVVINLYNVYVKMYNILYSNIFILFIYLFLLKTGVVTNCIIHLYCYVPSLLCTSAF